MEDIRPKKLITDKIWCGVKYQQCAVQGYEQKTGF